MRILYVNALYPPDIGGGAELSLAMLAKGQVANGHDVLVVATTGGSKIVKEDVDGVSVVRLPIANIYWPLAEAHPGVLRRLTWHARDMNNRSMANALHGVAQKFNPDVISFHNLAGLSAAAWRIARDLGRPSIQVLHDYYHLCPRSQLFRNDQNCRSPCGQCGAFRIGRARASNQVDAVVGASKSVLDAHLRNGLFERVGIRKVINNARAYKAALREDYPEVARTFGFIGTVAPWKGVGLLLEEFRKLQVSSGVEGRVRLLVAGGGEGGYLADLRAEFESSQIEFLGKVRPDQFFQQIDVSIVPSLWHDPLPGVVFESMIFGTPVIGARRGGIPEMIQDEIDGLLFEPDIRDDLGNCMRRIATEPGLLAYFGQNAQRASAHYADTGRVIDEYYQLYRTVTAL